MCVSVKTMLQSWRCSSLGSRPPCIFNNDCTLKLNNNPPSPKSRKHLQILESL